MMWIHNRIDLLGLGLGNTGLEAILESSRNVLQVSHSAGTGCSSSLSLGSPVERSHLGGGVSARGTSLLLRVERALATSVAQDVGLVVTLTHRGSTLRHDC